MTVTCGLRCLCLLQARVFLPYMFINTAVSVFQPVNIVQIQEKQKQKFEAHF